MAQTVVLVVLAAIAGLAFGLIVKRSLRKMANKGKDIRIERDERRAAQQAQLRRSSTKKKKKRK